MTRRSPVALVALIACVLVLAAALTWAFLGMRSVMDVGGACADGGPYVSAQPCPDGAVLLTVSVPTMLVAAMVGTAFAALRGAPNILVPMWAALFGSLGWNFLEYGFTDDGPVWGWIVCGVVFEAMALPAVVLVVAGWRLVRVPGDEPGQPQLAWYLGYAVLAVVGLVAGVWSYDALS